MSKFGERLKQLRDGAGLTQKELADKSGLGQHSISRWEAGVTEPDWSSVDALCRALGVSCEAFRQESATHAEPEAVEKNRSADTKPAKKMRKMRPSSK